MSTGDTLRHVYVFIERGGKDSIESGIPQLFRAHEGIVQRGYTPINIVIGDAQRSRGPSAPNLFRRCHVQMIRWLDLSNGAAVPGNLRVGS